MDNALSRILAVATRALARHSGGMTVVANRIRALRRRRGLTVEALAAAVGIHKGHLSRIERGEKVPSVATLEALALALGARTAELFGETATEADILVVRRTERAVMRDGAYAVQAVLPGAAGRSAALYVVEPGEDFLRHDRPAHDGQEIAYILEGEVELAIADRVIALGPGDCATYDGGLPHRLRRRGPGPASVLVVIAG
ncbi:cupin domain-containing protein [Methylobacterium currus]|uniref:Cupin domain-containing protein n=1 Tax=Methylobacterium currus TaxID=2051553 RepID=A0A2R4WN57_9HYPH|nr:cupin domain-containing protein [Methylobacterium currus]